MGTLSSLFKIPPSVVESTLEGLHQVLVEGAPLDRVMEGILKKRSKWGSQDRRLFATAMFDVVRYRYRFAFCAGLPLDSASWDAFSGIWQAWYWSFFGERGLPAWETLFQRYQKVLSQPLTWQFFSHRALELSHQPAYVRESWPLEWDQHLESVLGERWSLLRVALNQKAPLDLRWNPLRCDERSFCERWEQEFQFSLSAIPQVSGAFTTCERPQLFRSKMFQEGWFEVQDRASQQVALLLDPQPGEQVADMCAGAGGKTLHMASLMKNKGKIVAFDIYPWKLLELKRRARRAGVSVVEARLLENTKVIKRQKGRFDRILLDVPCTGLGVVRRNPDTKWRLKLSQLEDILQQQRDIFERYHSLVKFGGVLVYATCSIHPWENEEQIKWFLGHHLGEWELEREWKSLPEKGEGDGFYAARLRRIRFD